MCAGGPLTWGLLSPSSPGDLPHSFTVDLDELMRGHSCRFSLPTVLLTMVSSLAAWIDGAGIHEGAIFRRIWKGRVGPALLPGSVAAIVKRRARLAGLEGDFGAHSLRSGFVTEAGKQGVPLPAVMAMTEHRSVASVIGYFQAGAAEDNPAARLLK